jgi:hypothetical protein
VILHLNKSRLCLGINAPKLKAITESVGYFTSPFYFGKNPESAYICGAATCRGQNVSAYNVSGFKKFSLTFSTTYDTKKKKK